LTLRAEKVMDFARCWQRILPRKTVVKVHRLLIVVLFVKMFAISHIVSLGCNY